MAVRSFSNSICRAWQQARSVWESEFPSEESDQLQDLHELGMKCIWWLYLKYVISCQQLSTIVNLLSTYLCRCNDTSVADTVGSFCLSEPNSGSDAFALKTKAVPGQMRQTKSFVDIQTDRQTYIHPSTHPSIRTYVQYITLHYITFH